MSDTDPLMKDMEGLERMLRGTGEGAAAGAEKMSGAIDDLMQHSDQLASILTDTIDRLIELEDKCLALELRLAAVEAQS